MFTAHKSGVFMLWMQALEEHNAGWARSESWDLLGNIRREIMQQYSGALMHTLGTWAGWEQMHSGARIQGLTPSHTHCTEVEEARVRLIRTEAQLFVRYPLLLIWPHRSVPSVGFYAPSCPLCFSRGSHTKTAWPHRHLGELSLTRKPSPPQPPTHPLFSSSQLRDTTVQQLPHSKSQAWDRGLIRGPQCPSVTQLGLPQRTWGPAAQCLNGVQSLCSSMQHDFKALTAAWKKQQAKSHCTFSLSWGSPKAV